MSVSTATSTAISKLKFPFSLAKDQVEAVNAWIENDFRGTVLYSTGTGKTEIAFECAKRAATSTFHNSIFSFSTTTTSPNSHSLFNILLLVPRITLIEQNIKRLVSYGIPRENIGSYFGEENKLEK